VFGQPGDVDPDAVALVGPPALAGTLSGAPSDLRLEAIRLVAVMSLVDGIIEDAKLRLVGECPAPAL
jgi:hypothetical protein